MPAKPHLLLKKWSRPQLIMLTGAITLIFSIAALLTYTYLSYQRVFVSTAQPGESPSSSLIPSPTPPDPLAPFGVLLMGFGGPTHDGGYLTDTMIVAYVEPRQQRVNLISLPRDMWVQLPVTTTETKPFKINAAYAIGRDDRRYPNKPAEYKGESGGGALAKKVVSDATGLPIKYFVALSFDGFIKSIDTLGGVNVRVPVTFDDPFYPIEDKKDDICGISEEELAAKTATLSGEKLEQSFPCRFEQLHFDAGSQKLDGTTALKYVRSRHSPQSGGDYARSARQRSLIEGMRTQIFSVNFLPKAIPFISSLTRDMQLDVDLETLQKWIGQAEEYRQFEIRSIEVTDKNALKAAISADRQYILIPTAGEFQWHSLHEYIQQQLAASTSATPQKR
jgi:polyisoprenyl-teichoic acid--peptidoglycan teichoic acid transferase